jgi:hypothetical protein
MLSHAIPAVLIALAAPLAVAADPVQDLDGVEVAQLSIHQRIVIRVPRLALQPAPRAAPIRWKEKHGPHCIAAASLAGALVSGPDAVDLVLTARRSTSIPASTSSPPPTAKSAPTAT